MADLETNLNQWFDSIKNTINLSVDEKAEITSAGAEEFLEILKKNTPVSSINYKKLSVKNDKSSFRKKGHLKDSIQYKSGIDAEGEKTGNTVVGFGKDKYFNFLARITNNGKKVMSTKQINNLHFIEKSRKEANDKVNKAISKKYHEIVERKGNR